MVLAHRVGWDGRFIQRSRWFWPLARAAERFADHPDWPTTADLDALYAELAAGKDVRLLRFGQNVRKQDKRVGGRVVLDALYDARIAKHGEVPSRDRDWHDFFNALCFATFPRAKLALHTRQHAILEQRVGYAAARLPGARTREQDALTLFDEGGVVVACDPAAGAFLDSASQAQREQLARVLAAEGSASAGEGGRALVVPFGHALFEHLIEGLRCPGGCTQTLKLARLVQDQRELLDDVDVALATALHDPTRFTSPKSCAEIVMSLR